MNHLQGFKISGKPQFRNCVNGSYIMWCRLSTDGLMDLVFSITAGRYVVNLDGHTLVFEEFSFRVNKSICTGSRLFLIMSDNQYLIPNICFTSNAIIEFWTNCHRIFIQSDSKKLDWGLTPPTKSSIFFLTTSNIPRRRPKTLSFLFVKCHIFKLHFPFKISEFHPFAHISLKVLFLRMSGGREMYVLLKCLPIRPWFVAF